MGALWVTDDTLSLGDGLSRQWRGFPWVSGGTLADFCIFNGDFPNILRKNQLGIHITMESMESIAAIPVWNDGTAPEKSFVRFVARELDSPKWQEYLKNHQVVVVCIYLYILRWSKRLYILYIHTCIEKRKPSTLTCKRVWACDFAMWLCGSFSRSSLNRAMHAESGKEPFLSSLISGNES